MWGEPSQGDQYEGPWDTPASPCCGVLDGLPGIGWILEQLQWPL